MRTQCSGKPNLRQTLINRSNHVYNNVSHKGQPDLRDIFSRNRPEDGVRYCRRLTLTMLLAEMRGTRHPIDLAARHV